MSRVRQSAPLVCDLTRLNLSYIIPMTSRYGKFGG
jgi:hypothetical protein